MPDGSDKPVASVVSHIGAIDAADWDNCAGTDNPFVSHAFLSALEESGAVNAKTGWQPQHLIIQNSTNQLLGAVPLYLKGHSYGEYVFDWNWADAYERAGGRYYPKLLAGIPFTPVNGPRLLVPDGPDRRKIQNALGAALQSFALQQGASSVHVNFCSDVELDILTGQGFLVRHGHQYHWQNEGYETFDDFLTNLSSRKRKAIKKERRQLVQSGIKVTRLTGDDLKAAHWDAFYHFYKDTYDRKWGSPYMSRDTFQMFHDSMRDKIMLVMGYEDGVPIAGALNFIGSDALYGRNWGAVVDYKFLHFEACYYQAIDFAIERKLKLVEAGTQGEHKIQRGYLPVATNSAHWFGDEGFYNAIERFLGQERLLEAENIKHLKELSPFKQVSDDA